MAELVDAPDSKSGVHYGRAGSIPVRGTKQKVGIFIVNPKLNERKKIQTPEERRAASDLRSHSEREEYPRLTRKSKGEQVVDDIANKQAETEAKQKYHEAWQNYYQKYYERYYLTQLANQRGRYTETEDQRTKRIRSELLNKITGNAKKFRKSKHYWPIMIGVITVLIVLFIQFNQVLTAGWHRLIAPNFGNDSGIIIAEGTGVSVNETPTILIPKLSVKAPIIFDLPDLSESTSQANLRNGTIHFPITGASSKPGQTGNTVILGHSSGDVFDDGAFKFVFVGLERLDAGDLFYIDYQKIRYTYQVERKEIISPSNLSYLRLGDERPYATLVTCTPIGTNINRLLVIGRQISPSPVDAPPAVKKGNEVQNITGNQPTLFERLFR